MSINFLAPLRIVCQGSNLGKVGSLASELSIGRELVVSAPGIIACGFAAEIFDKVEADSPVAVTEAAVEHARTFGADGVIGLGGGSSLDTDGTGSEGTRVSVLTSDSPEKKAVYATQLQESDLGRARGQDTGVVSSCWGTWHRPGRY
jgi:alcohol dehydrogenase class IV